MPVNPSDYDHALICENGHVATSMVRRAPEHDAPFCEKCGAKNLKVCGHCQEPIRGYYFGGAIGTPYRRPAYCVYCGNAFPWTEASLEVGRELLDELEGLETDERERLKRALEDIGKESPRTEAAAGRLRRALDRASGPTGQALLKVATEIASEAARKILLGAP